MPTDALALIAAKPGLMRDSFRAVLAAIPRIKVIDPVNDGASALKMVAKHQPALVLLDTNLPDDQVWTLLQQIKAQWPQVQCLVLADDRGQFLNAQAAGADHVLIKGCRAREFYDISKDLISRRGNSKQPHQ